MASKWFNETFLPSIYERCEARGREMWLSQKQTAICTQNMDLYQVRYDPDGYGVRYTHNQYRYNWDGRYVSLSYSKKNGCGYIIFGMSVAEEEEYRQMVDAEKRKAEVERIERIKRNPERLAKRIEFYTMKINELRKAWEADKEEACYDLHDDEWYSEKIAKFEKELALYMS